MKRIIWVDDDIHLMQSMVRMFNDSGFSVRTCTNLTDALKELRQNYTNNLLIDVEFPNSYKEGLTFLENISDEYPDLNVVILTGFPDTDDVVRMFQDKLAAAYLKKGSLIDEIYREQFFSKLHEFFDGHSAGTASRQELKGYEEFEKAMLWKWRKPAFIGLFTSFGIILFILLVLLALHSFDLNQVFEFFETHQVASYLLSFLLAMINLFFIRDLYNKYFNHSNINNYISRNIKGKQPKYLK